MENPLLDVAFDYFSPAFVQLTMSGAYSNRHNRCIFLVEHLMLRRLSVQLWYLMRISLACSAQLQCKTFPLLGTDMWQRTARVVTRNESDQN